MLNQENRENLAACARMLSQLLYYPPSESFLHELGSGALSAWPLDNDASELAISLMLPSLADRDISPLNRDYTQLLVGPGKLGAYPWGSVYTDTDQCLYGETEREFRKFCLDNGIAINTGNHEPADHIGLVLAVFAELVERADGECSDEAVKTLIVKHLEPWVSNFQVQLEGNARTSFYSGVALLLKSLLQDLSELTPTT